MKGLQLRQPESGCGCRNAPNNCRERSGSWIPDRFHLVYSSLPVRQRTSVCMKAPASRNRHGSTAAGHALHGALDEESATHCLGGDGVKVRQAAKLLRPRIEAKPPLFARTRLRRCLWPLEPALSNASRCRVVAAISNLRCRHDRSAVRDVDEKAAAQGGPHRGFWTRCPRWQMLESADGNIFSKPG